MYNYYYILYNKLSTQIYTCMYRFNTENNFITYYSAVYYFSYRSYQKKAYNC